MERYSNEEFEKINNWWNEGGSPSSPAVRSGQKDEIVQEISNRSGLSYEQTNEMIKQWSRTSNDANPNSLQLQKRASELFNAPMSDWQQVKYSKYVKPIDISDPMWAHDDVDKFLKAMYENTQDRLNKAGFKTIKMQRGIIPSPEDLQKMKSAGVGVDDIIVMNENTMESWTTSNLIAEDFGDFIIEADVPIDRIIGSAKTGFGCLEEYEYVVLGSDVTDYATVIKFGY